ncbi:hypothetical protein THRCLA_00624 [Thraustotheca clavata]|uniref:Guanylate cyclase domain-containing protein n=1 Tax=Thraustotheca clavata TaxID=74557 RepID=A0A1W0ABI9_9STRA|nr:hypothetical protein THRCLA_00624 [Thraustotheca clavata]
MVPAWTIIGLLLLIVSFICLTMALWSMHYSIPRIKSCVFRATFAYLISRTVHALAWSIVSISFIDQFVHDKSTWLVLDSYYDAGGFRILRHDDNELDDPPSEVIVFVFIGDIATISGALWMLVLVVEVINLAKKTLDRGSSKELWTFRRYTFINIAAIAIYTVMSFSINGPGFFSGRYTTILIISSILQALVLISVSSGVWYLRTHSRKYESTDGQVIQSPLYLRLKRILIVYVVTSMPYLIVASIMLACSSPTEYVPRWAMGTSSLLYYTSGAVFALILVGSQDCFSSCFRRSEEVRPTLVHLSPKQEAPTGYPVFVNTDIESSSHLWSQLGPTMNAAQEIHDNLLRALLVRHRGYEITTCGDAFQLAFHTIADAVAYCLDVQLELISQPWPVEFVDSGLPGSWTESLRTNHVPLMKPKPAYLFHGIRVRMGIHASSEAEGQLFHQVHPVTHRSTYVGLSELIGREVGDLGNGGQIIVTERVAEWLAMQQQLNTSWNRSHSFVLDKLGVYSISDLKIDLKISQVLPLALKERMSRFKKKISNLRTTTTNSNSINRYDLMQSPREVIMVPIWSTMYAICFIISYIATSTAAYKMHRTKNQIISCVFYATFWYFISKALYSFTRLIVMSAVIYEFSKETSSWLVLDHIHDAGGIRLLASPSADTLMQSPPTGVLLALLIGDAVLIAGALWMLILVIELIRLAKKAMDRGTKLEKRTYTLYAIVIWALVLVSGLQSSGSTENPDTHFLSASFYSGRFEIVLIVANAIQTLVILLAAIAMWYLRKRGCDFEGIDGQVTRSPLYLRLKRILMVYCVTSVPYMLTTWLTLIYRKFNAEFPSVVVGIVAILYHSSGLPFAIVMVGSQQCCLKCLLPLEESESLQSPISKSPPKCPVFVNTDIESSSHLWNQLGPTMNVVQEIHDNLLRALLVRHHGYEITTCGDAFQLAFHTISDAVAYCLDVQLELLSQPWPVEFIDSGLPGSWTELLRTNYVSLLKPKHPYLFHGLRVRMGIHASSETEGQLFQQIHPVTHRTTYVGLSELIGREVGEIGNGGQIIVTAPVLEWLMKQSHFNTKFYQEYPFVYRDLGVYNIVDLKIHLAIAEILPVALKSRQDHFHSIPNLTSHLLYERHDSTAYDLLRTPLRSNKNALDMASMHSSFFCTMEVEFPTWTIVYLIVLLISLTATTLAVWTLKRSLFAIQSCVYYATLWYFVWKSIYALSRTVLMCIFLNEFNQKPSRWLNKTMENDVSGLRILGTSDTRNGDVPTFVVWVLFISDAALLSGVLWMIILVVELTRLAKKTMDRGPLREKQVRRNYLVSTTLVVVFYFTVCQLLSKEGLFSNNAKFINIVSNTMQTIVIVAVGFGMVSLRQRGQKFEGTSGEIEQSPLYSRLKRILIVFMVFSLPYTVVNWIAITPESADNIPTVILGVTQLLYFASGLFFALVMVASQECFSMCMSREKRRTRYTASSFAHAPTKNPVFVNTDIESSSFLWGQLGQTMHDAQELHDDLLRSLLVKHKGYEITTCGDAFQLAFHDIADAVAYCLDVQVQLLHAPWPIDFVDSGYAGSISVVMPKSTPLPTRIKHPYLFRGLRVRMGIHASNEKDEGQIFTNIHPVTQRTTYVGLAEMIGREVSDLGNGGQIIVTARVASWLRKQIDEKNDWWHANACTMKDLGVYRINDLKIDLGIAQVLPEILKDRSTMFRTIGNTRSRMSYQRHDSTTYDLLMSPGDDEHILSVDC